MYIDIYIYIQKASHCRIFMMQGCHTPPPPPHPMASPVVVVLFGLVAFPVWSCLASPPPPPCGVGPVVFLVGPAPPTGGNVFYRGMVWLLPLVSSNVIVTCLVPSPPCGVWPVVVLVDPAQPVWGSVFYRDMVCDVLVTIQNMIDVALFSLQTVLSKFPLSHTSTTPH